MPVADSILYFQTPPSTSLQKIHNITTIRESERKARLAFPELFHFQYQDDERERFPSQLSGNPPRRLSIPYKSQHLILGTAQKILEECCYNFVLQWIPLVLEDRGWDCAEAGELTSWTRILSEHWERLPSRAFAAARGDSKYLLVSVNMLRHTAGHRRRTTIRGVKKLVHSAQIFTEVLNDPVRAMQLRALCDDIGDTTRNAEYALDSGITAMMQNKLDGIIPQTEDYSFAEEVAALFENMPLV